MIRGTMRRHIHVHIKALHGHRIGCYDFTYRPCHRLNIHKSLEFYVKASPVIKQLCPQEYRAHPEKTTPFPTCAAKT